MFQIEQLDHVGLTVTDLEFSAAWYQSARCLEPRFTYRDTTGYGQPVGLGSGAACIVLFPAQPGRSVEPLQGHVALKLTRENFERARPHLNGQGISVEHVEYKAMHSLYCLDPDGYQIELSTYDL